MFHGKSITPVIAMLTLAILFAPQLIMAAEDDLEAKLEKLQEEQKEKVLSIVDKNKDCIVMVEVVLKMTASFGGQQLPAQERKFQINGTVIDKNGLVLISNSRIDPSAAIVGQLGPGGPRPTINSEILETKIILNDGTELPAKIIGKDSDLDLAFVKPEEAQKDMPCVTLNSKITPGLLDPVLSLTRMDMKSNRATVIKTGAIAGIIEKPRKYYVCPSGDAIMPAFDSDGNCFGIFVVRGGGQRGSVAILPAEDVVNAKKQVDAGKKEKAE